MTFKHTIAGITLDLVFGQRAQERLGHFIPGRARGEDNDDDATNGEYALLLRMAASGRRPEVVFDVGANKGEWSAQARQAFGEGAEIYASEPVCETHTFLEKQLAVLPASEKTHAIHAAMGDTSGTVEMRVFGELAGSNSLYQRSGCQVQGQRSESVCVQRGDAFCSQRSIRRINLLKIDTEGHEMAVLRGFNGLLAQRGVDVIQFEYGGTWIDAGILLKEAFALLVAHGYRMGRLMPNRVQWFDAYSQKFENFRYCNWVAALPTSDVS